MAMLYTIVINPLYYRFMAFHWFQWHMVFSASQRPGQCAGGALGSGKPFLAGAPTVAVWYGKSTV